MEATEDAATPNANADVVEDTITPAQTAYPRKVSAQT